MKFGVFAGLVMTLFAMSKQGVAGDVWSTLQSRCGMAYEGTIVKDTENSSAWADTRIVMHVRDCSAEQIKVPLHVGDNRSRVWIVTKLKDGQMRLKHDHRHEDGHPDDVTMYGGTSTKVGMSEIQFPVDSESIAMFNKYGLEASVTNIWHLQAGENSFHYKLTRPSGREFEIRFDLTAPVPLPPKAWDLAVKTGP